MLVDFISHASTIHRDGHGVNHNLAYSWYGRAMAQKTVVNIRLDQKTVARIEKIAREYGMTRSGVMQQAIRLGLTKFVERMGDR